jgi:hypothetical protein
MFPCSKRASLLQIAGDCSKVFIGLSPGGNAFISDIGKTMFSNVKLQQIRHII